MASANILDRIANPGAPPSVAPLIDRLSEALGQRQERNTLDRIGGQAARGDIRGASATAFGAGKLDIGARLQELDTSQRARLIDTVAAAVMGTTTPEEYGRALDLVQSGLGLDVTPYRDFGMRDAFVAEAVGAKQMLTNQLAEEGLELERGRLELDRDVAASGDGKTPPPYRLRDDGTQEYVPGGSADPEIVRRLAEGTRRRWLRHAIRSNDCARGRPRHHDLSNGCGCCAEDARRCWTDANHSERRRI